MTASETGDAAALPDLLKSDAWSALIEIAKSLQAASMSINTSGNWSSDTDADIGYSLKLPIEPAQTMGNDGFEEIPQHLLDEINGAGGSVVGSSAAPAEPSGPKACPHCTFENPPSNNDCELCGLPLAG